jgi:hypothetical protein
MLPDSAVAILKKHFVFDRIFDLIEYDLNIDRLYQELKILRKDSFESNYRFIFLHYDTEYYITQDSPGITIINLQKILESLDISNYFCLVLTQQTLQKQCQQVRNMLSTDVCSIKVITSLLQDPCYPPIENKKLPLNATAITKKYMSLNRTERFHRRILVALLKHKNLLKFGMVSYRGTADAVVAIAATSGTVNIDCGQSTALRSSQTISITGNITLAFDNATWPSSGTFGMIRLQVTVDAAGRTMTLPVGVSQGTDTIQGLVSSVLTFATAGTFEFEFSTIDAGTTIVMHDFTRPLDGHTNLEYVPC